LIKDIHILIFIYISHDIWLSYLEISTTLSYVAFVGLQCLECEEVGVIDAFYDDLMIKTCFMIVELIKTCLNTSGMHFLMI
jgi:hypothetical protein